MPQLASSVSIDAASRQVGQPFSGVCSAFCKEDFNLQDHLKFGLLCVGGGRELPRHFSCDNCLGHRNPNFIDNAEGRLLCRSPGCSAAFSLKELPGSHLPNFRQLAKTWSPTPSLVLVEKDSIEWAIVEQLFMDRAQDKIGRASCRERVYVLV